MPKRNSSQLELPEPDFVDVPGLEPGLVIRVDGEWGLRFKVWRTTASPSGKPIVECWEMEKGAYGSLTPGRYRAFYAERVKAA